MYARVRSLNVGRGERHVAPSDDGARGERNDGAHTFEGRTLATLTLPQKEDLDVDSVPLEVCTFCAELFVDCVADTLGLLFCTNAGITLGGGLLERRTKDVLERVCEFVLWH
jgi:uncharacterized protein (DUF2164 family)